MALAAADTYVVVLALPDMMAGVGLGIESLQRATPIISGFLLGYIAVLPLIGRLADLVDRRRILLWCLAAFVVGSATTAMAVELPVLVGGRVLQGLGGGGLVPATLALVADLWPVGRRGTPLGIVGAVQELGSVLGPLLGAVVLVVASWREIFWLNVVLGLLLAVAVLATSGGVTRPRPGTGSGLRPPVRALTWLLAGVAAVLGVLTLLAPRALVSSVTWGAPFVPFGETSTSRVASPIGLATLVALLLVALLTARAWGPLLARADLLGATCIAVALGSLVLTFSSAEPEQEVVGPWGLWLLPIGAAAALLYLWRHRTAARPLIPRGVVRARVVPAMLVSVLVGTALVAIVVDVPLLARLTLTDSQTEAAFVLIRFLLAVPVGAVLGGRLLRRVGHGVVAAPGLLLTAIALFVMSGWSENSLADGRTTTVVLAAAGLGIGLAIAPVNDAALADAPASAHGMASALVVAARMGGMVVGLALLTALGLRRFHDAVAALPDPADTDALRQAGVLQVQTVFEGAALAALMAAAVALALGLRRPTGDTATEGRDRASVLGGL